MAAWKQWKYPLTLSLFFVLIYVFCGILDPNPSVNLPDDIRLLLADRRRMQLPEVSSRDVSVVVEHNIRAVIASELLYAADNTNGINREYGKQQLNSNDPESGQKHNKLNTLRARDSDTVSEDSDTDSDRKKIDRWLHHREIIGNERFVNRFRNGIQKPEDFYERNKDVAVKIRSKEHAAVPVKIQSSSEIRLNTSSSNGSRNVTHRVTHFTNQTANFSVTDKYQKSRIYMRNVTPSQKETKPSNSSTDLGHFVRKIPDSHLQPDEGNVSREVNNKTESTITSMRLVKAVRSNEHVHSPNAARHTDSSGSGSRRRIRNKSRVNGTTLADLEASPYPPVIVKATGAFLDRVRAYNAAIASVGAEILRQRGYGPWRDVADPAQLKVVWGNDDDFLERLSEHAGVKTVLLPWVGDSGASAWSSLDDRSNVLVKRYYAWSATPPLCGWIQTPGFTKARWDAVYDRECNEEMSLAARPQSLEFMYFYAKPINVNHYWPNYGTAYPAYFYTRPPPYVFYVHLIQDAVVNVVGDVISGDLKLVPYTCSHDNLPTVPSEYPERPVYRGLFVMTQFWGRSFFHKIVEVMPRVAPYVAFLRANPSVQIHAPEDRSQVSEMLRMIGLDPVRVVTGVTRAKLVYLPQGTPCGFPDARSIQLLSRLLRQRVRSTPRNRLVYVRRSGLRRVAVEAPVEFVLQAVAERHQLNYTVFGDRPTPPLSTAAELFSAAVVVVGPHGAGLSNVVFCQPGTALVEGVCNEPHVNMCYEMTAHMLGLRYHAIPSRGGCERVVDVTASDVETAVEAYVDMVLADVRRQPQQ